MRMSIEDKNAMKVEIAEAGTRIGHPRTALELLAEDYVLFAYQQGAQDARDDIPQRSQSLSGRVNFAAESYLRGYRSIEQPEVTG